jgi:peptidoglycan/xylan/chitin deacetylase (PgdA/CDA1 family)
LGLSGRAILVLIVALTALLSAGSASAARGFVEPHMHLAGLSLGAPRVALTFDACMGGVDMRILSTLVSADVPATIFVTGRWIRSNPNAVALLKAHPDLFEIEDHGARHLAAVLGHRRPYGVASAGTMAGVLAEADGGAAAIRAAFGIQPKWYRDATALYSPAVLPTLRKAGYAIGAYSLNADFGASVSSRAARANVMKARDGDVIIAHVNQPRRPAGQGIAAGILALKARGFAFVRLDEATVTAQ